MIKNLRIMSSIILLLFLFIFIEGCVGKKRYLAEVSERENLFEQLQTENEKNARLQKENLNINRRLETQGEEMEKLRQQQELHSLSQEQQINRLQNVLSEKEEQLSEKDQRLSEQGEELAKLRKQHELDSLSQEQRTNRLQNVLSQKEKQLSEKDQRLSDKAEQLFEKDQRLSELEAQLSSAAEQSTLIKDQLAKSERDAAEKIQNAQEMLRAQEALIGSLKNEIDDGNIKISKMNDRLSVQIVSKILFPSGSDRVSTSGEAVLKKVSASLKSIEKNKIRIEGHTDNVPIGVTLVHKFPSNWELSTSRATQVVRHLAQEQVNPENMLAVGMAEFAPIASNDTPEGRQKNRRIEIVLIPK